MWAWGCQDNRKKEKCKKNYGNVHQLARPSFTGNSLMTITQIRNRDKNILGVEGALVDDREGVLKTFRREIAELAALFRRFMLMLTIFQRFRCHLFESSSIQNELYCIQTLVYDSGEWLTIYSGLMKSNPCVLGWERLLYALCSMLLMGNFIKSQNHWSHNRFGWHHSNS